MEYSHSYLDPETDEIIHVMIEPDSEHRNAPPRARGAPPRADQIPGRHHGAGHHQGPGFPNRPQGGRIIRRGPAPYPIGPTRSSEYLTVRKSAIAELLPIAGKLWASFLTPPDPPQAVGDDIVDRDNASMHRQALSTHQQNQTRILALTDLAHRAVTLFLE